MNREMMGFDYHKQNISIISKNNQSGPTMTFFSNYLIDEMIKVEFVNLHFTGNTLRIIVAGTMKYRNIYIATYDTKVKPRKSSLNAKCQTTVTLSVNRFSTLMFSAVKPLMPKLFHYCHPSYYQQSKSTKCIVTLE